MRKDLERTSAIMMKIKNPSFSREIEETIPMEKMKAKPIAPVDIPTSPRTIKKVSTAREKTQPELAKDYEFSKRARKSAPTFNEITTKTKLGINKGLQGVDKGVKDTIKAVKGVTKVKVANSLRSAFAPNTTVKRDYADPTRVNLGDGSKLGDKKTVQKLDKEDGTVLKTKTKQVVSKKPGKNDPDALFGSTKSGRVSINTSKRSKFADEGIEGFSNKKTRYRKTRSKAVQKKNLIGAGKLIGGIAAGFGAMYGLVNVGNKR
jgi:hypothetical protein